MLGLAAVVLAPALLYIMLRRRRRLLVPRILARYPCEVSGRTAPWYTHVVVTELSTDGQVTVRGLHFDSASNPPESVVRLVPTTTSGWKPIASALDKAYAPFALLPFALTGGGFAPSSRACLIGVAGGSLLHVWLGCVPGGASLQVDVVELDGAVLRAIEGEVRHAHPVYGDFAISRWVQEDDIERFRKYGEKYYSPGGGSISRRALAAHERRVAREDGSHSARGSSADGSLAGSERGGSSTPRRTSPRRALWGGWLSSPAGGGRSGRSGKSKSRGGSASRSRASRSRSRGSRSYGSPGGSSRASWFRHFGPPSPRWLASWRRDFAEYEVAAKIGDAVAVANERGHKSTGSVCASGGMVNSDAGWVTSDTWEAEISARRQLQHNLDGRVAARFVAREVEAGVSYHFTEEFKGWHVNAKTILSPQGINTPEFTLHHVWDF